MLFRCGSLCDRICRHVKKLLLVGLLAAPAFADDVPGVVHELVDSSGSSFERFEASGASYFAGRLAIVDDLLNTLFVFDTASKLLARLDASGFLEEQAKFEDIAYDNDQDDTAIPSRLRVLPLDTILEKLDAKISAATPQRR